MDSELRNAFSRIFQAAQSNIIVRATLGSGEEIPDPFSVPGYPERVYCLTADGTKVAAISNGINLVRNANVLLIPVPTQTSELLYEVMKFDPDKLRDVFGENARAVQAGSGKLGLGNDEYIESLRLLPGLVGLVSGLTFRANPFFYRWGGVRNYYDGSQTVTIAPPSTSGKRWWVLIGFDPTTGLLTSANGAQYGVTTPIGGNELDDITFTGIPLLGVMLNYADTTITGLDRVMDAREWLADTTDLIAVALDAAVILAPTTTTRNLVQGTATGVINLILKLFTGQTAAYIEGRDASDNVIWSINKDGIFNAVSIQNTAIGTTTPASGFFSALRVKISGFFGIFTHANSADRTYTFPDRDITVAGLDDIPADTGITELTGDATAGPGSGSQALTLATVNATPGTYSGPLTVVSNAKGLITSIGTTLLNLATQVTGKLSLTNLATGATVGQALLAGATDPAFGALNLAGGSSIVTGVLPVGNGGTGSNLSATGPGHVQQATSGAVLTVIKDNFAATAAPTVSDDNTAGYAITSRWYDTTNKKEYVLLDATTGAAVWKETTATGGGSVLTTKGDLWGYDTTDARVPVSATDDDVLTSDSADAQGVSWKTAKIDIVATAGEAISARDLVYIKPSDNKIYKIDTDAAGPLVDVTRGIAPIAISNGASGKLRYAGQVTGFSSLTAGGRVYASTTAGGYTQTKPTVSAGGSQVALIDIGYADSTTTVIVQPGVPVQYLKRGNLANNGTLTIIHHADALAHDRSVLAYVATSPTVTLTNYADSNQDAKKQLRGQSGAGGTTNQTTSNANYLAIGQSSGTNYEAAQSFQVTAGQLSQFKFTLGSNTGTPTGDLAWKFAADNSNQPGTVLASGTVTPTASAQNTVNVTNGPILNASTKYWLWLAPVSAQSNGNFWRWDGSSTSTYANGDDALFNGSSWSVFNTEDRVFEVTTSAVSAFDKLSQGIQFSGAQVVSSTTLYLDKVGTPTDTLTLRMETDSGGFASGILVDANATATVAESSLSTSLSDITFIYAGTFNVSGSTQYHLVLSTGRAASNTNYVEWGIDTSSPGYTGGALASYISPTWSAASPAADGCFAVLGNGTAYEEPCVVGRWSGGTRDVACRYDDGSGSNPDTKTTIKNVMTTADITMVVELP